MILITIKQEEIMADNYLIFLMEETKDCKMIFNRKEIIGSQWTTEKSLKTMMNHIMMKNKIIIVRVTKNHQKEEDEIK